MRASEILCTSNLLALIVRPEPPNSGLKGRNKLIPDQVIASFRAAFRNRFFRATVLMAVVNALGSMFAFLYQVAMAKLLTPAEFGTLASLLAVFVILSVLAPAFQLAAAKFASQALVGGEEGQVRAVWIHLVKRALTLGGFASVTVLLLLPVFSWLLDTKSVTLLVLLATSFLFAFAYPVSMGMLQGMLRYKLLAAAVIATPLTRFVLGATLVVLGFGLVGAFVPIIVGEAGVLLAGFVLFRHLPSGRGDRTGAQGSMSYMIWTALAYGSFILLANLDVVLAKHYLDPQMAGEYAALSVLGKIVLFAPVGVSIVLFAETAGGGHGSHRRIVLLGISIAYTIVTSGATLLVFGLFPERVILAVVGEEYIVITPLVLQYGGGMLGLAVTFLLMHYHLAMNQRSVVYPIVIGIVLHAALMVLFHNGVSELANIRLFTGIFTPLAIGLYMFRDHWLRLPRLRKTK